MCVKLICHRRGRVHQNELEGPGPFGKTMAREVHVFPLMQDSSEGMNGSSLHAVGGFHLDNLTSTMV